MPLLALPLPLLPKTDAFCSRCCQPIVFAGIPTMNGGHPAAPRIKNIMRTCGGHSWSFEMRLQVRHCLCPVFPLPLWRRHCLSWRFHRLPAGAGPSSVAPAL